MSKLSVSEIFFSLQGEGIYIGIPQVFVRFCGCNLRCAYCDTAAGRAEEYDPLTLAGQVRRMMKKHTARSISLTGGEPLLQSEKIRTFLKKGRFSPDSVYLETNGTLSQEFIQVRDCVGIVAVDIKLPSSTAEAALWPQHERFLRACRGKKFFVKAIIYRQRSRISGQWRSYCAVITGIRRWCYSLIITKWGWN